MAERRRERVGRVELMPWAIRIERRSSSARSGSSVVKSERGNSVFLEKFERMMFISLLILI